MSSDCPDSPDSPCRHFVVERDGNAVGALRCTFPAAGVVHLQRFCILSHVRGCGVGRAALAALEEYYRPTMRRIELDAKFQAEGFYRACGYRTVSGQVRGGRRRARENDQGPVMTKLPGTRFRRAGSREFFFMEAQGFSVDVFRQAARPLGMQRDAQNQTDTEVHHDHAGTSGGEKRQCDADDRQDLEIHAQIDDAL